MARASLSNDGMRTQTEPLLPDQAPRRGGRRSEHRLVVEAICSRFRTGSPRRDLPADFPAWQRVWWWRFDRWAKDGTLDRVLGQLQGQAHAVADLEWVVSVDSTVAPGTSTPPVPARVTRGVDRRIVGFTGRRPPHINDARPKYLNSPSGPVYDKSRYLYGFSEQQTMMHHGARPLLVEGPLDVLAVTALGLEVAPISTCGTALSSAKPPSSSRSSGTAASWPATATRPMHQPRSTPTNDSRHTRVRSAACNCPRRGPASLAAGAPHILARLIQKAPPLAQLLIRTTVAPFLNKVDNAEIRVSALHAATPPFARPPPPVPPPTPNRCRRPRRIAQ